MNTNSKGNPQSRAVSQFNKLALSHGIISMDQNGGSGYTLKEALTAIPKIAAQTASHIKSFGPWLSPLYSGYKAAA